MECFEKLKKQVKKNYKFLVENSMLEKYMAGLIEPGYFDITDKELVMNEPSTEARNEKFLDLLLKKNPKAVDVLIKEIRDDNRDDVVKRIQETEVEADEVSRMSKLKLTTNFHHCHPCDICLEKEKHAPAIAVCSVCREFYCEECANIHRTFKISKDHLMWNIGSGVYQSPPVSPDQLASEFQESIVSNTPTSPKPLRETVLVKKEDRQLGKAQHMQYSKSKPEPHQSSTSERKASSRQLQYRTQFEACYKTDSEACFISGIACLPNGHVVAMESRSESLIWFDECYNLYFTTTVAHGWNVASVKDDIVAVTADTRILFYECGQSTVTKLSREYYLPGYCSRISYNKVYAVVINTTSIVILDDEGCQSHELENITTFGAEIKGFWYIALHPTHEALIISDHWNCRVVCISYVDGYGIWQVPVTGNPYGLTLTDDSLLTVTHTPCAIIQINIHDDQKQTNLTTEGVDIHTGLTVTFQSNSDLLYFADLAANEITVFSTK